MSKVSFLLDKYSKIAKLFESFLFIISKTLSEILLSSVKKLTFNNLHLNDFVVYSLLKYSGKILLNVNYL